jgi:competence protein ComEA
VNRVKIYLISGVLWLLLTGCGRETAVEDVFSSKEGKETVSEEARTDTKWYVQIDGAVKKPGVYPVDDNTRVFEVIELAGGVTKNACLTGVNQAEKVTDAQQIHVYTKKEMRKNEKKECESSSEDGKVNLNVADKQLLLTLPGIGESKADLIIQYREDNGKFSKIEDIMKIQGIKEGVFRKIKNLICV